MSESKNFNRHSSSTDTVHEMILVEPEWNHLKTWTGLETLNVGHVSTEDTDKTLFGNFKPQIYHFD